MLRLSTQRLFVLILLLGGITLSVREVLDPDVWWHLRTGQYIAENHAVPRADVFSSTSAGRPWVAHEWLSELLIYGLYRAGGLPLLALFFGAVILATFALCWARAPGRPLVAGVAILLAAMATMPTWGVRPQMLSALLTSIFLWVLARHAQTLSLRTLLPLVPLTLLWVNLHAGYAIGLALIAIAATGWSLDGLSGAEPPERWRRAAVQLAVVFAACLALVPLNPNGWWMYVYPLATLRSPAMQTLIVEWFSPNFHDAGYQLLAVLLFATFGALAVSPRRPRWSELLLLTVTAYAALRSARHIMLFALAAAPLLATYLSRWLATVPRARWLLAGERIPSPRRSAVHAALAVALIAATGVRTALVLRRQAASEARQLPVAAAEFIRAQRPPAPIFNWYNWGGYLIWKLYPEYRVFIDGRADLYGDQFLTQFVLTCNGDTHWVDLLDRYHVRTVMVPGSTALASLLRQQPAWTKVYEDQQAVIFTRPQATPANQPADGPTLSATAGQNFK